MTDISTMEELCRKLDSWDRSYRLGHPEVSDREYDLHYDRLTAMEKETGIQLDISPTRRVGSDLNSELQEAPHSVPVLSLDKAYSAAEVSAWMKKLRSEHKGNLVFTAEEKLDGVSLVIYYVKGKLDRALTRGDGYRGSVITDSARTLKSLPLVLPEPLTLAVRGEVYLPKRRFEEVNKGLVPPYANPRNLAAGTLRRVKSKEVAKVPLEIQIYEGFFENPLPNHREVREKLESLGFPVSHRLGVFGEGVEEWIADVTIERSGLDYEIDGLVFKVDDIALREELGYTGHHPRWALAYKFESPQGETRVEAIDVQVGRTGRMTPVARVEPVTLAGATITNITLHNQAYIDSLELGVGDTVAVSRRGDVIPAVERVLEKTNPSVWKMPLTCPSCGSTLVLDGGHHFCLNPGCKTQRRLALHFFTAKDQMNMETLGPETLDYLFETHGVLTPADLYIFDYTKLLNEKGFGEKKVQAIEKAVETSKTRPFVTVLASLGLPELGHKSAELLVEAGLKGWDELKKWALEDDGLRLKNISGFGEVTVKAIFEAIRNPETEKLVQALADIGLQFEVSDNHGPRNRDWEGQVWCVTGSFEKFNPRSLAELEIRKRGGRTVGAVSSTVTHLLVGSGAGSKLDKARSLGIPLVTEEEFLKLLDLSVF